MPITYGRVCSGIEAATMAWHPLGMRAIWLAEIEPLFHYCANLPDRRASAICEYAPTRKSL